MESKALKNLSLDSFISDYTNEIQGSNSILCGIRNIPHDWQVSKLGNYCQKPDYGYTISATDRPIGPKILRITDIQDEKVDWKLVPYCGLDNGIDEDYFLKNGDIVVARIGATTGKAYLVNNPPESVFASYLIRIRTNSELIPEFLNYYLQTPYYWKQINQNKGGRLKGGINIPVLKNLIVPIPPLTEQRKIAVILSTVDASIEATERIIAQTELVKNALLYRLFNRGINHVEFNDCRIGTIPSEWDVLEMKDITERFISGGTPSTKKPDYWEGNIHWTTSAHIDKFYLDSGERFINEDAIKNSPCNVVPKNNVLIGTRVGIGKIAVNRIDIAISQDLTGIVIDKSRIIPEFLVWYLKLPRSIAILNSISQGTSIKGITREELEKIEIPQPSISEQQKIVDILGNLEYKLDIDYISIERLKHLKNGLMQVLLIGKVRVKVDS